MSSLVRSYYSATANPAPIRPALAGETSVDACVIGGGLTGLSAALHLAERGYKTLLLEAEQVGWGASGRNGGQLNTGLRKGAGELIELFGRERAKALFAMAEEAKALVRGLIARHAIACDLKPGSLYVAYKKSDPAWMAEEVELLHEVFGHEAAELLSKAELEERLGSRRYHGGIADARRRPSPSAQFRPRPRRGGRGRRRAHLRAEPRPGDRAGRGHHRGGAGEDALHRAGLQRLSGRARAAHRRHDHADLQLHRRDGAVGRGGRGGRSSATMSRSATPNSSSTISGSRPTGACSSAAARPIRAGRRATSRASSGPIC